MDAIDILSTHKLKRTSCRDGIINVVLKAKQALSEQEIRERLEGNYDRTTFYRSFKTLEFSGIIHKIVIDNQLVKYAVNGAVEQHDSHAHFYCNDCNTVQCLESAPVSKYQLPEGYAESQTEVIIKGTCAQCYLEKV